jgi:hypothetical protein
MYQSFAPQHQASGVYWQRVAFRQTLRQCVIIPIELPQPPPFNLLQPLLTFGSLFLSGGADLRKLTTVYYLNHSWRESLGGLFRIFHPPPNHEKFTDIEPRGDRLIVFWSVFSNSITAHSSSPCSPLNHCSNDPHLILRFPPLRSDQLVHSVTPSHAPGGEDDHRWSMTVWVMLCLLLCLKTHNSLGNFTL